MINPVDPKRAICTCPRGAQLSRLLGKQTAAGIQKTEEGPRCAFGFLAPGNDGEELERVRQTWKDSFTVTNSGTLSFSLPQRESPKVPYPYDAIWMAGSFGAIAQWFSRCATLCSYPFSFEFPKVPPSRLSLLCCLKRNLYFCHINFPRIKGSALTVFAIFVHPTSIRRSLLDLFCLVRKCTNHSDPSEGISSPINNQSIRIRIEK